MAVVVKRDSNHFKSHKEQERKALLKEQHTVCAEDESEAKDKKETLSQVKILSSSKKENLENV